MWPGQVGATFILRLCVFILYSAVIRKEGELPPQIPFHNSRFVTLQSLRQENVWSGSSCFTAIKFFPASNEPLPQGARYSKSQHLGLPHLSVPSTDSSGLHKLYPKTIPRFSIVTIQRSDQFVPLRKQTHWVPATYVLLLKIGVSTLPQCYAEHHGCIVRLREKTEVELNHRLEFITRENFSSWLHGLVDIECISAKPDYRIVLECICAWSNGQVCRILFPYPEHPVIGLDGVINLESINIPLRRPLQSFHCFFLKETFRAYLVASDVVPTRTAEKPTLHTGFHKMVMMINESLLSSRRKIKRFQWLQFNLGLSRHDVDVYPIQAFRHDWSSFDSYFHHDSGCMGVKLRVLTIRCVNLPRRVWSLRDFRFSIKKNVRARSVNENIAS